MEVDGIRGWYVSQFLCVRACVRACVVQTRLSLTCCRLRRHQMPKPTRACPFAVSRQKDPGSHKIFMESFAQPDDCDTEDTAVTPMCQMCWNMHRILFCATSSVTGCARPIKCTRHRVLETA